MEIKPEDLIITTGRDRSGGMWVALPDTFVTIYHKPSGLEVTCDEHRSQHRNKDACMKQLQEMLDES